MSILEVDCDYILHSYILYNHAASIALKLFPFHSGVYCSVNMLHFTSLLLEFSTTPKAQDPGSPCVHTTSKLCPLVDQDASKVSHKTLAHKN